MTPYNDRIDAAEQLLATLPSTEGEDVVVLALPRGGVPIGAVIARALHAPLDLLMVRKVGAPHNPELAVGAVTGPSDEELFVNERVSRAFGLSRDAIRELARDEVRELKRRKAKYTGGRPAAPLEGRTVIVVDDGIATGTTALSALRSVRAQKPARVILAVPVASEDALELLRPEVDEIACPLPHLRYGAVGASYRKFPQVSDDEVIALMQENERATRAAH